MKYGLEKFRESTGWIHHWAKDHEKHQGVFPDICYVTGMVYSGLLLLDKYDGKDLIDFYSGYVSRWNRTIPGKIIRDVGMTGRPDELMLNRDQRIAIAIPGKKWIGEYEDDYADWREYAKWRPRHWMLPNHASFFDRVHGGDGSLVGDLFEYANVKMNGNVNRTVSSSMRLCYTILRTNYSWATVAAFKLLDRRRNIEEDFTEYATRSIPGDEPGEHPRFDLIWHDVLKKVREIVYEK